MNNCKTIILIYLEKSATKGDDQYLKCNNNKEDDPEEFTGANSVKEVKFILDSSAANKVENLKEHENIENKSEMPGVIMILLVPYVIIIMARDGVELTVSYCAFSDTIVVLSCQI